MATTTFDMRGLTIGLDHEETTNLVNLGGGGTLSAGALAGYFTSIGIVGAAVPYVAAAVALHVAWELAAIKAADKGHGVWLNAPPLVLIGLPGVVIPSTRTDPGVFDGSANVGTMSSATSDTITWSVDRGAGTPNECKFVLINETDWHKAIKMRIGASEYWIQADPHAVSENGTYLQDLGSTSLVFHKPQFLGAWGPAGLAVDSLAGLQSGDNTYFRWVEDS